MYTLEFDTEIPKICIPIVGTKEEEIIKTAEDLVAAKVDLIEWRADYCSCILEDERLCLFLQKLRRSTGSTPLLFTIRTTAEGGELTISFEQYIHTLQVAAQSECVDYIDVEMFWWDRALSKSESVTEGTIREAVQALQQHVQVIGSYHDFQGTPQEMQITKRLLAMHENGADIPKMAVMPQRKEDVMTLMCATLQAKRQIWLLWRNKCTGADSFGGASGCIEAITDFIEEAVCALHSGVKWHNDIVERNGGAR